MIQLIVGKRVVGRCWILIPEGWLVCLKSSVRDRIVSLSVILRDVRLGWSVVVQLSVNLIALCWVECRSHILIKCWIRPISLIQLIVRKGVVGGR